ncbi:MAG: fumarylacetoacetate hydrolase family protein [Rhodospirillaceae bacterium]|jgi:2-keto-4-pentenoate hydratase/2-oxohepta-3-ene-1,7-dioic acid hydratase in catechol pathway
MRLITFLQNKQQRIGVLTEDDQTVVDLVKADRTLPNDMNALIAAGAGVLKQAARAVKNAGPRAKFPRKKVKLLAPIPKPIRNVMCVGKNYYDHAHEFDDSGFNAAKSGAAIPKYPIIFTKMPESVIGPGAKIPAHLDYSKSTDYEVELGVIIGKKGRKIPKGKAFDHVFGYTIINDVTAREIQRIHNQWFLGKSLDGYCPMGPYIATKDEVGDIKKLQIQTHVNGELRQNAYVKGMIFDVPTLIKTLSAGMMLLPGDVIATGTCTGIGGGFNPPKFLRKGDTVTLSIDKLGVLKNKVS